MDEPLRVGVLDSGISGLPTAAARGFRPIDAEAAAGASAAPDDLGHGSAVASVLRRHAPACALLDAQVLNARGVTSAAAVAAGLEWLVGEGADMVTLCLGLAADRAVLRAACAAAVAADRILLAASPARGAPVYPSAYPGVIRITGDARCGENELSHLATEQADFGACVRGAGRAGASLAVAHATGLLAAARVRGIGPARAALARMAVYRGPERRTAADAD